MSHGPALDSKNKSRTPLANRNDERMDAMSPDEDETQVAAIDDDDAVQLLAPFYDARPARQAWRGDPEDAPIGRPVYAREPDSIRVLIAIRDEEGWAAIRRDGEVRSLDAVASWAPLAAAIT